MATPKKNPFGLSSTISRAHDTNPNDVMLVKRLLSEEGHYKVPDFGITPYPDTGLFEGIKNFQNMNGLKVDGVVKPDGPTIQAMARSPRFQCTNCGAFHGGVYSPTLCHNCYVKLS